jgi:hypothetical protein
MIDISCIGHISMVVSKSEISISPEEYLEGEKISPLKHEYIQGQVYAMAGASDAHNLITGSFYSFLRNHLRGKGCLPYTGDMKAQIDVLDIYYYPDILVTCDPRNCDRIPLRGCYFRCRINWKRMGKTSLYSLHDRTLAPLRCTLDEDINELTK